MLPSWVRRFRNYVIAASILPAAATTGKADDLAELRRLIQEQSKEIQEQGRQLEDLRHRLDAAEQQQANRSGEPSQDQVGADDVRKIVGNSSAEREAAHQQEEGADRARQVGEWYLVGSDLKVQASFKDGLFLWFDTPHQDFTMHLGAWMQYDNVFWSQSRDLLAPLGPRPGHAQGVASGVATGGIGDLEDGTFFRRIRPFAEGTFWEIGEYRLIPALEKNLFSTAGLDEFWVGVKDVPFFGTVRVGHIKNPFGLEGDTTTSSRAMTFMERSAYSDSIDQAENLVTGIFLSNNYLDQRITWEASIFRSDIGASTGVIFGDGQWGAGVRLTGLPLYECEGRQLLHLGVAGGWRNGSNDLSISSFRTFQSRARPELRDDDPAASPPGAQIVPNANSNRLIDTGVIAASDLFLLGTELLYIQGPFSFQAEYGGQWIVNAIGVAPVGFTFHPAIIPSQNYVFHGGYVQVAYTLTGENRAYDKRFGTLAREYYGKRGPFTNAWFVRGEDGKLNWGIGAWELAARYSYVTLNGGNGLNRIQGGTLEGLSLALNWYLSNNANVMFDYVWDQRDDVPVGTIPGNTRGFGIELQFQF